MKLPALRALAFIGSLAAGFPAFAAERPADGFISTRPAVRVEYWQRRLSEITAQLERSSELGSVRLVFLGDSITDFWTMGDNPWFPGQKMGRAVWEESFGGRAALNLGISGDRTEHVLHRILPQSAGGLGELDAKNLKPEFVIVLIGVNNTWDAENPVIESVVAGIKTVVAAVHERQPRAKIILQSLLPLNDEAKNQAVIRPVNQSLQALATTPPFSDYTTFLSLYPAFVDAAGRQIPGYFADGVHPNEAGYRVWRTQLLPMLGQLPADHRGNPKLP